MNGNIDLLPTDVPLKLREKPGIHLCLSFVLADPDRQESQQGAPEPERFPLQRAERIAERRGIQCRLGPGTCASGGIWL